MSALSAYEWPTTMRANFRRRLWKVLTLFAVMLLALNPEMFQLALFVDAVGLDLLILLFELQALAIVGGLFLGRFGGLFRAAGRFCRRLRYASEWALDQVTSCWSSPALLSPTTLMHALVISTLAGGLVGI